MLSQKYLRPLASYSVDNVQFDITVISESRLLKNQNPANDFSLPNYTYGFCLMETNAGQSWYIEAIVCYINLGLI